MCYLIWFVPSISRLADSRERCVSCLREQSAHVYGCEGCVRLALSSLGRVGCLPGKTLFMVFR